MEGGKKTGIFFQEEEMDFVPSLPFYLYAYIFLYSFIGHKSLK